MAAGGRALSPASPRASCPGHVHTRRPSKRHQLHVPHSCQLPERPPEGTSRRPVNMLAWPPLPAWGCPSSALPPPKVLRDWTATPSAGDQLSGHRDTPQGSSLPSQPRQNARALQPVGLGWRPDASLPSPCARGHRIGTHPVSSGSPPTAPLSLLSRGQRMADKLLQVTVQIKHS